MGTLPRGVEPLPDPTRWTPTGLMRWFQPSSGPLRLEQQFRSVTGETEWRPVPVEGG